VDAGQPKCPNAVVRRAVSASLSAVRRQYRPAHRRCGVADEEGDQVGGRLRRDRVRHHLRRERSPVLWGCRAAAARPRSPGSRAAELDVEDACQVDESGPCRRMARSPGGRLRARWHLCPAACAARPPWLSHRASPKLTSIMSCRVSGVVVSASPGRNAPMVFTSTSGGPTSPAIRSMRRVAAAGSVVSATSRRTLSGSSPGPGVPGLLRPRGLPASSTRNWSGPGTRGRPSDTRAARPASGRATPTTRSGHADHPPSLPATFRKLDAVTVLAARLLPAPPVTQLDWRRSGRASRSAAGPRSVLRSCARRHGGGQDASRGQRCRPWKTP
jgi:hypothetical protein